MNRERQVRHVHTWTKPTCKEKKINEKNPETCHTVKFFEGRSKFEDKIYFGV